MRAAGTAPLELEQLESLRFRGRPTAAVPHRVFGGQFLAHALLACGASVRPDLHPHSLHGYFVAGGDPARPVDYTVAVTRDGRTVATRQAVATQDGREVFRLMASFSADGDGVRHQIPEAAAFGPGDVAAFDLEQEDPQSARWFERFQSIFPFELRYAALPPRLAVRRGQRPPPRQQVLLRWPEVDGPDRLRHAAAMAFMSDALLLSTSLFPHGRLLDEPQVHASSLDHAMWFHQPLHADQWHLYRMESDWAGHGRALCHGRLYETSGVLAATVAQEGLLRFDD